MNVYSAMIQASFIRDVSIAATMGTDLDLVPCEGHMIRVINSYLKPLKLDDHSHTRQNDHSHTRQNAGLLQGPSMGVPPRDNLEEEQL